MRPTTLLLFLAASLLAAGCLQSVHPLYDQSQVAIDPDLLGIWVDSGGDGTLEIRSAQDRMFGKVRNAYAFSCTDAGGDETEFTALVGQTGDYRFLDTTPASGYPEDSLAHYYLPLHQISRIWVDGDTLRIAPLDEVWFRRVVSEGRGSVDCEDADGRLVVTASSEELQAFLRENYADGVGATGEPAVYHRMKP